MTTADWISIVEPEVLLVGENSTLQWKYDVADYAMFLDYYFEHAPYDLGERSKYSEAKSIFAYLSEISADKCRPEKVYGTLLCNEVLQRPPLGKHMFVSEAIAKDGLTHIRKLLKENPTIKYVYVMGLQTNYYLQKLGFYNCGDFTEKFLKGAEPRRVGATANRSFYQPVDAKPFREVCFKTYEIPEFEGLKLIPILPIKSYPLKDSELNNFGDSFDNLKKCFETIEW
jgi:hypothetical protein